MGPLLFVQQAYSIFLESVLLVLKTKFIIKPAEHVIALLEQLSGTEGAKQHPLLILQNVH